MKSQPIDVGLLGKLPPGTSLYHYVDQVSIYSITEPLQKSLNLLSHKQELAKLSVEHIEKKFESLKDMIKVSLNDNLIINQLTQSNQVTTNFAAQYVDNSISLIEKELDSITSILVSSTSLQDRIAAAISSFRSSENRAFHGILSTTLDGYVKQLPTHLAKATECLHRAKSTSEDLENQLSEFQNPFMRCEQIKKNLFEISGIISNSQTKLQSFQQLFDESFNTTEFYLNELNNLVVWYTYYLNGYYELLFEIQRRKEEQKRLREFVTLVNRELDMMHNQENQIRQQFLTNFGQYLPSSLCALPPDATKLRIIEKHEPALPQLSKQYKRQEQEHIEDIIFTSPLAEETLPTVQLSNN